MGTMRRLLYTSVLITMGTACAPRAARVVANPLATSGYVPPVSNAYDVDAHVADVANRDRTLALAIEDLKADVKRIAHVDFFFPQSTLVYPIFRAGYWLPEDRRLIRSRVAKILKMVEERRAFQDDEKVRWDWERAHKTLVEFDRYEAMKRQMDGKEVARD